MLYDDLNFPNNGKQSIPNLGPTRHDNEGINAPQPINTNLHENNGEPHVGRVPKASTTSVAPTFIDKLKLTTEFRI